MMQSTGQHPTASISFNCSEAVRDLLMGMLNTDPSARLSLSDVARHPWVQSRD